VYGMWCAGARPRPWTLELVIPTSSSQPGPPELQESEKGGEGKRERWRNGARQQKRSSGHGGRRAVGAQSNSGGVREGAWGAPWIAAAVPALEWSHQRCCVGCLGRCVGEKRQFGFMG
jgi:hypothetical protein